MQLLPYHKLTIRTQEPLSMVIEKLEAQIQAPETFRWGFPRPHAPYTGTISESGFKIYRIIHYRNSFLPVIRGQFESSSDETLVHITMRLHPFVIAFLIFWLSIWYSISIPLFLLEFLSGNAPLLEALLFLGLPLFILLIFAATFRYEVNRSHRELTQIITGRPLPQRASGRQNPWLSGLIIFVFIGNVFFLINRGAFFSGIQQNFQPLTLEPCSQPSPESSYCNLAVAYTFEGYPTELALAISSDGKTLVSGGEDKAIKIWDLQTGELKKTLQSDSGVIYSLAIAPNGKTVVSGSGDHRVRIWDLTSDQQPKILQGHSNNVTQVEISSDGKTIMSLDYDQIKIWDLETGQLKTTLSQPSREFKIGGIVIEDNSPYFIPITVSSDNTALVRLGSKIIAWNVVTNQQVPLQTQWFENLSFSSAKISLDGETVAMTSYRQPNTYLKLWDMKTGLLKAKQLISSSHLKGRLNNLVLTSDHIIGSTPHEKLKIWNLQTLQVEATLDQKVMSHLVGTSDGNVLAGITGYPYNKSTQIQVLKSP